jgi:hypothetical protein
VGKGSLDRRSDAELTHDLNRRKAMARKYSEAAKTKVKTVMHELKKGTLKSGSTGKTVTSRKQAIAIGISEARRAGKKVPKKKSS